MDQFNTGLKLTPAEYWEWRTTIAEIRIMEARCKCSELEFKLLCKEAEILSVRTQLYKRTQIEAAKEKLDAATAEYVRIKEALEVRLGTSLNGKVIDEVTFEVKVLPDEAPKSPSTNN